MKLFLLLILFIPFVYSANWQQHPEACPVEFESVSCTGGELQCGDADPGPYCYDMTLLSAPGASTSNSNWDSGTNGGWVLNCESTDGSEPYCDNSGNFWCDRSSSCYNVGRTTQCEANTWANESTPTTCTTCRSGYTYCDGDYEDGDGCEIDIDSDPCSEIGEAGANNNVNSTCECTCDANWCDTDGSTPGAGSGCDTQDGSACETGGADGTYSCALLTCVPEKSNFETGTFATYLIDAVDGAMLWFKNLGNGWLINATNVNDETWGVNNDACMVLKDGTEVCDSSDLVPTDVEEQNAINLTGGGRIYGQLGGDVIFRLG